MSKTLSSSMRSTCKAHWAVQLKTDYKLLRDHCAALEKKIKMQMKLKETVVNRWKNRAKEAKKALNEMQERNSRQAHQISLLQGRINELSDIAEKRAFTIREWLARGGPEIPDLPDRKQEKAPKLNLKEGAPIDEKPMGKLERKERFFKSLISLLKKKEEECYKLKKELNAAADKTALKRFVRIFEHEAEHILAMLYGKMADKRLDGRFLQGGYREQNQIASAARDIIQKAIRNALVQMAERPYEKF